MFAGLGTGEFKLLHLSKRLVNGKVPMDMQNDITSTKITVRLSKRSLFVDPKTARPIKHLCQDRLNKVSVTLRHPREVTRIGHSYIKHAACRNFKSLTSTSLRNKRCCCKI